MKIRSKKQLNKVADAARMLHPDMSWMWISKIGQVHLSTAAPIYQEDDIFIMAPTKGTTIICPSRLVLKMKVSETVVHLMGEEGSDGDTE